MNDQRNPSNVTRRSIRRPTSPFFARINMFNSDLDIKSIVIDYMDKYIYSSRLGNSLTGYTSTRDTASAKGGSSQ